MFFSGHIQAKSNQTWERFKVDREDHFWHPGFLHIIMCFPKVQSLKFLLKNLILLIFTKTPNSKGLNIILILGLFEHCSCIQI